MNILDNLGFRLNDHFEVLMAIIVLVVSSARLVRLITSDKFPPMVWLRVKWDDRFDKDGSGEGWGLLLHCPWCAAPYVVAANLAWALLSDLQPAWWVCNGWLAASYAASWIVFHDED